jgi:hypothetical protein
VAAVAYRSVEIQTDPPFTASPVPAERAEEPESVQPQTAHPSASSPTAPPISALQPPPSQQVNTEEFKNQLEGTVSEVKMLQRDVHLRDVELDSNHVSGLLMVFSLKVMAYLVPTKPRAESLAHGT